MNEREWAQEQARREMEKASRVKNRARVLINDIDVTEDVVSILDALIGSLDWGSGFLSDDEVSAVEKLAQMLDFENTERDGWEP